MEIHPRITLHEPDIFMAKGAISEIRTWTITIFMAKGAISEIRT